MTNPHDPRRGNPLDDPKALLRRARARYEARGLEGAAADYEAAVRIRPALESASFRYARALDPALSSPLDQNSGAGQWNKAGPQSAMMDCVQSFTIRTKIHTVHLKS
ncbi:hypothetical protein VT85_10385 [Planctomyces sp. SH-PL62]|nr:hypothetical protein VT85_10385 [Planctomyces sp. SH-PL62]